MKRINGYTLIELLFIIIVIAILVGIAVPRLGFEFTIKMKTRTAARRLVSDLRYTRRLAITNDENYRLSINSSANEYRIYDSGDTQTGNTRTIDSDITISGDKDFIFESLGNVSTISDISVSLSTDVNQVDITVTVPTGRVNMQEI